MLDLTAIPRARAPVVDESRMLAMLLLDGWAHDLADPVSAERAMREARSALAALIASGLPVTAGCFDAYQAVNAVRQAGLARTPGVGDLWRERFVATARKNAQSFAPPLPPRRFELRMRREVPIGAEHRGQPVTVRVPVPLEGNGQADIAVEAAEPGRLAGPVRRGDGWAEAAVEPGPTSAALELEVAVTLEPRAAPADPTAIRLADVAPGDAELYLRAVEGTIAVTPAVAALAARLAQGAPDPWTRLTRFWRYLFGHLRIGPIYHHAGDDPLSTRWSDCLGASSLLVGMCRASAIPARLVGGWFAYATAPTNHFWAEVLLPPYGWVPFDLSCWELAAGDPDDAWAPWFFGRVDYRVVTERFPRQFSSRRGLHIPRDVVILQAPARPGAEITVLGIEPHLPIYADRIEVR